MDRRKDGRMDGRTEGRTEGRTLFYRTLPAEEVGCECHYAFLLTSE